MSAIPTVAYKTIRVDWRNFAADFRAVRARQQIGLRSLAALLGTSAATLSRVENDEPCAVNIFMRLAYWMSVDPLDYIGWDGDGSDTP